MQDILDFMKKRLNEEYYERFMYAFESGKRVRPKLMKSVCKSIGKDFHPLLAAASAIEVMHCVSLVHDDIIDKAEQRRGLEPFSKKYGTNSAVLFGDLFATMAIEILAEEYNKEIYLEFIKTFKNMIEGQIIELENRITGIDSYFEYVEKKTVSLFVLSAKIPLMYYGVKDDKMIEFAKEFGIMFQLSNDLKASDDKISIRNFIALEDVEIMIRNKLGDVKKMELDQMNSNLDIFKAFQK